MKTVLKAVGVAVVLLLSLFPTRYVNSLYGWLPFLALCTVLLLSELALLLLRGKVSLEATQEQTQCRRGEKLTVGVKVVNRSFLICPRAKATLYLSDLFGGEDSATPVTFTLAGRSEAPFSFDVELAHIGVYSTGVRDVRVYDLLGLFSVTLPGRCQVDVTVLPRPWLAEEVVLEDKLLTENFNARKNTVADGFDYSGVREYAVGDSMKRVHWKLSAHSHTYMTKLTETCKITDLSVLLDFIADPADRETLATLSDTVIETGLAILEQAARQDTEYYLVFADREGGTARLNTRMGEGADYAPLVRQFPPMRPPEKVGELDGAALLEQGRRLVTRTSNTVLCTSRVNEQVLHELIQVKQQQRNPMLFYILPPGLTAREREERSAPLKLRDDAGISYRLLSAGEVRA